MDVSALVEMLTDGLPAEQAAVVKAAIERDATKTKVSSLKAANEYQQILDREAAIRQELDGDSASGKLGAKAYRDWYAQHQKDLELVLKAREDYVKKFGKFDGTFEAPTTNPQQTPPPAFDEASIQRMVDKRIQEGYAPRWSDLVATSGTLVQKHMFAGRKTPIDFTALGKLAEKYGGNLESAYEEWDKPERERVSKEDEEKRIEQKVQERLQQKLASQNFPGGADMTPGTLSAKTKTETDSFDKTALSRKLAGVWNESGSNAA